MLTLLAEWISWLKAEYSLLFDLFKFGSAIAAAFGAVWAVRRRRIRDLDARLKGQRAELAELERKHALFERRLLAATARQKLVDEASRSLGAETAEAAHAAAERERRDGNHEFAAARLDRWFQANAAHLAEISGHLADWQHRKAEAEGGDHAAAERTADLRRLSELFRGAPADTEAEPAEAEAVA